MKTESRKQRLDILKRLRLSPNLVGLRRSDIDLDGVTIEITVRGRSRVTPSSVGEFIPVIRSRQVGLLSVCPKDRANGFLSSRRGERRSPWQGLDLFLSAFETQLLEQHSSTLLQVERVDVQSANPDVGGQDVSTHVGDELRADRSNTFVILLHGQQNIPELLRHDDTLTLDPSHKLLPRLNRHDPRDDRHIDSCGSNTLDPVDENVDVVEHLGENEVGAGVDLFLQVLNLLGLRILSRRRLGVSLRETGDGDVKVVSVFGTNVFDEIDCLGESSGRGSPVGLTVRGIASESEDVLASVRFGDLQRGQQRRKEKHFKPTRSASLTFSVGTIRRVSASFRTAATELTLSAAQMHARLHPDRLLTDLNQVERQV